MSIRRRLLAWLAGPLLLIHLLVALLTYLLAIAPAQLAFDRALDDTAAQLAAHVHTAQDQPRLAWPAAAERALRDSRPGPVWYAVRHAGGALVAGDAALALDGATLSDTVVAGVPVRLAQRRIGSGDGAVLVGVARPLAGRHQVRDAVLRSLLLLEATFALALVGVAWFSVANGLAPLARLREALDRRDGAGHAQLDAAGMPSELAPVVAAFNGLLARVAAGTRAQEEFLANAAHQLRTPLAGMRLQLEWLAARHAGDADSARSTALLLQANERLTRQVNQLLALSRADAAALAPAAPLRLDALVAEAVQALVEQAAARGIDLGFALDPAPLRGDPFLLRDLIDNLVDNALRYTPRGGQVTVRCGQRDGVSELVVEDNGPGIAPAQRERVFERFVRLDERSTGSGLGLAIVRGIARHHGAEVLLGERPGGGALVRVRFPAA